MKFFSYFALAASVSAVQLKTNAVAVQGHGMSDEYIDQACEWLAEALVSVADRDGNGMIDQAEGDAFMEGVKYHIASHDVDGNGMIDAGELKAALKAGVAYLNQHMEGRGGGGDRCAGC